MMISKGKYERTGPMIIVLQGDDEYYFNLLFKVKYWGKKGFGSLLIEILF